MNRRPLIDCSPDTATFQHDVLLGLRASPKSLPCQYFYDAEGSRLFDEICELEEYYLTRAEIEILQVHGTEMASRIGASCQIVEYGSGSGIKTQLLFECLREPVAYVPVDISRTALHLAAPRIATRWPHVEVLPVAADYTRSFALPATTRSALRTVVFFPGSTIGNFHIDEVATLLANMAGIAGHGGAVLVGVDLEKDRETLEAAYNDERGVTAAFNRNLLVRMNRELGADFRLEAFEHRALWEPLHGRMEMHLISREAQHVHIGETAIPFAAGETIHTESSYKYSIERFHRIAIAAGLTPQQVWTDAHERFSVHYLTV